jgi:hypothetical protein
LLNTEFVPDSRYLYSIPQMYILIVDSEFTILHSFDPECNVCMEDVHFHNDRVTLHLKASKTDPFREGVDIHLLHQADKVCQMHC